VQIALVIAKAARFDFPQHWPTLFNDLLAGLNSNAAEPAQHSPQQHVLLVRRTYFVLHHVLKELSSKRLAADQKAFAQVRQQLVCDRKALRVVILVTPEAHPAPNTCRVAECVQTALPGITACACRVYGKWQALLHCESWLPEPH
jgi:hypothetical protein